MRSTLFILTLLALTGAPSFAKKWHRRLKTTPRYTTKLKKQKTKKKQQQSKHKRQVQSKKKNHYTFLNINLALHIFNSLSFFIIKLGATAIINELFSNPNLYKSLVAIVIITLLISTLISYLTFTFSIILLTLTTKDTIRQKKPTFIQCLINSFITAAIYIISLLCIIGVHDSYPLGETVILGLTNLFTFLIATYTSYTKFEDYRLNLKSVKVKKTKSSKPKDLATQNSKQNSQAKPAKTKPVQPKVSLISLSQIRLAQHIINNTVLLIVIITTIVLTHIANKAIKAHFNIHMNLLLFVSIVSILTFIASTITSYTIFINFTTKFNLVQKDKHTRIPQPAKNKPIYLKKATLSQCLLNNFITELIVIVIIALLLYSNIYKIIKIYQLILLIAISSLPITISVSHFAFQHYGRQSKLKHKSQTNSPQKTKQKSQTKKGTSSPKPKTSQAKTSKKHKATSP